MGESMEMGKGMLESWKDGPPQERTSAHVSGQLKRFPSPWGSGGKSGRIGVFRTAPMSIRPATLSIARKTHPMVHQERVSIETSGHRDMHDITDLVAHVVARSAIETGVAHVFNIGSTGSVGMVEFEPGLQRDVPEILDKLIPPSRDYGHELAWHDGNGHSHLQATLLGPSLSVPVMRRRPGPGHVAADFPPGVRRETPADGPW